MATAAQLKALRKKHHLGEFSRSKKRSSPKRRSSYHTMARRSKRRSKSRGPNTLIWGSIIGAGGFVLYETFISPRIPINEPVKSFLELGIASYLARKGGIIGNTAKVAVVLNVYQLLNSFVKPVLLGNSIPREY